MKDEFILNIIHRPELSPEYTLSSGSTEKDVSSEALDIFRFQQETSHKYGLKTTIHMTYASLFSDEAVSLARRDAEKWGDEIGVSLLGLPCDEFRKKYKTDDFLIWMFSDRDKERIVDDVFTLFRDRFGFYPASTGSYFLDAHTINYIKTKYPSVVCAVATCFEEGPRAYHTCNNSWYIFTDGGPWSPYIPSKVNSHCPAADRDDDCGLVAIPHLSRDLIACYDGNGSNFGTHPQNVLRGLIYYRDDGGDYRYPYLYNLIDQYRHLARYNDGNAYNMMYVGPGWLSKSGRWEAPYELLAQSYDDAMAYYGKLKDEGRLYDMTMSEYAVRYRERHPDYTRGECALWKDILYGSRREYFWYADPTLRACLDFSQGGALIDLRPYVARLPQHTGIGSGGSVYDASFPYLVQSVYRSGYFTHYAGAGTVKSCRVSCRGESADLCLCPTMAVFSRRSNGDGGADVNGDGDDVKLSADPVRLTLGGLDITVTSTFTFVGGRGELLTQRQVSFAGDGDVTLTEYFTGGFGTTEYQPDMSRVTLGVNADDGDGENVNGKNEISYAYRGRELEVTPHAGSARGFVRIPDIDTVIEMSGENVDGAKVREGIAFSPVYGIELSKTLHDGEEVQTCLRISRVN